MSSTHISLGPGAWGLHGGVGSGNFTGPRPVGFGFGGLGFTVWGQGFKVVQGLGFRVQSLGFRV